MHQLAMLNAWEIILILAVVLVLFAAKCGFDFDIWAKDAKKGTFYLLMTAGAVVVGCLLAIVVVRVIDQS